ncbi:MAG TPA: 16S rRNA (guanine(527)-N(7))-methyltransferase RsmG [Blastocatellia bacterium]|nr:16S rRNA (guanine(527)-N(7))-methyltransferase RsmG [Blastocatellia bacterium]
MSNRAPQEVAEAFRTALTKALADYEIPELSAAQRAQLVTHYRMMLGWNRRTNLTRITEPDEAARLHYADSLAGHRFVGAAQNILDIGSGAGFPAIPLAVLRPEVCVTALEANQKKSLFLAEVRDALGLANFRVATARVESFDLSPFDLLTSRALDRAEEVLPEVVERMHAGQRFMLYCTKELLDQFSTRLEADFTIQAHAMPQSTSRLIAIFATSSFGQKH